MLVDSFERNEVFWIVLNRPDKANAINSQMWRDISFKIDMGATSPNSRVLAISGTGKYFSSGEDIADLNNASTFSASMDLFLGAIRPVFDKILKCPKPVLAAVNGQALGAGVELIFACDMAIAKADASFSLSQGKHAIGPALALTLGIPILGRKRLIEMAMTGNKIDAEQAVQWGIVNSIAHYGLESEVEKVAQEISQTPATLIRTMKEVLLRQMTIIGYETAFDYISLYSQSQETKQGISAFLAER